MIKMAWSLPRINPIGKILGVKKDRYGGNNEEDAYFLTGTSKNKNSMIKRVNESGGRIVEVRPDTDLYGNPLVIVRAKGGKIPSDADEETGNEHWESAEDIKQMRKERRSAAKSGTSSYYR